MWGRGAGAGERSGGGGAARAPQAARAAPTGCAAALGGHPPTAAMAAGMKMGIDTHPDLPAAGRASALNTEGAQQCVQQDVGMERPQTPAEIRKCVAPQRAQGEGGTHSRTRERVGESARGGNHGGGRVQARAALPRARPRPQAQRASPQRESRWSSRGGSLAWTGRLPRGSALRQPPRPRQSRTPRRRPRARRACRPRSRACPPPLFFAFFGRDARSPLGWARVTRQTGHPARPR